METEERRYTLKELQEISQILKHDISGSTSNTQLPHGPTYAGLPNAGLFSRPGSRLEMFGTNIAPVGLMDFLPIKSSVLTNPQYDILTGFTGARGTNANNMCETGARAGLAKICTQTAQFGEFKMTTDPIIINKAGARINVADGDRKLMNPQNLPAYLPDVLKQTRNINSVDWFQLYAMGIQAMRVMETVVFNGNHTQTPAQAELGFIREFAGLDLLIKTGHVDAISGNACAAVDSIVDDWGDAAYTATVEGDTIVQRIALIFHALMTNAKNMGLLPVQWALVMYDDLFFALTRVWPCLDMLAGCSVVINGANINSSSNIDGATQRKMQDEMYNGQFLWIDGNRVPVITSQGVPLENAGGGFSSTIYFVPLTVLGGYEVLYIEGFDQGNPEIMSANSLVGADDYRAMNGGFWAMTYSRTHFCKEYTIASQPRLLLETPFLAARLDGVNFSLNHYSRQFRPSDPYWVDGGATTRFADDLYGD